MKPNRKTSSMVMLFALLGLQETLSTMPTAQANESGSELSLLYSYPIVDTLQNVCSDDTELLTLCTRKGANYFGQDAQYMGLKPDYRDNQDGTVTDNVTGLTWSQTTDINRDGVINAKDKLTFDEALNYAASLQLGGYEDWRLPTIKELYSLVLFDGQDPSGYNGKGSVSIVPFIDHSTFGFQSGDTQAGERLIDSQYVSSTKYVSTTMNKAETVFGVNFIHGRIKGYGLQGRNGADKTFYVMVVRGNTDYGLNQFVNNHDGTITDKATQLTWQKEDSGTAMNWPMALTYCENLKVADVTDWRLPNIKELQSIVDYTRSPDTSNSAAISSVFASTSIVNEAGQLDYANYWSSTTHANMKNQKNAAYIAFGRSLGYMNGRWMDVHGAGSQRSDPKVGNPTNYPTGKGPQGDAIRINNFVRCVSGGASSMIEKPEHEKRDGVSYSMTGSENSTSAGERSTLLVDKNLPDMGISANSASADGRKKDAHFSRMDRNGDGKLSKQEVKGPLAADFARLDINGDGFLSENEIPTGPPKR